MDELPHEEEFCEAPGEGGGGGPGGGGDGPGDGGGGGGDDGYISPERFGIHSDEGDDDDGDRERKSRKVPPLTRQPKSPFETKAAKDEVPRYKGKDHLAIWGKKVTHYLHSKCPDMNLVIK